MSGKECSIDDCTKEASRRGWCRSHYERYRRMGNPLGKDAPDYEAPQRDRAEDEKRCGICGEVKGREHFYVSAGGYLSAYCKPCHKDYTSKRHAIARANRPPKPPKPIVLCDFEGCDRKARAKGLCFAHWQQQDAGKELKPIRKLVSSYINDEVRKCTGCMQVKTTDAFYKRSNGKSQQRCKKCMVLTGRYNAYVRQNRLEEAQEVLNEMPEFLRAKYEQD